jgi:acetyl-CoA acyltransferase
MPDAFICDAIRTPIGKLNGGLSSIRADDLAAIPIRELAARNAGVDWETVDDTILGCANQAGEDNRNVARMAVLLAGLPEAVPGTTVNRLCGSGLNAVGIAAQAIRCGDAQFIIAGGVESMSRAPYVLGKANSAFDRSQKIEDTTLGWRFVNPAMRHAYGVDSMPETGENVADVWRVSREDQDRFALASQEKAAAAIASGRVAAEIVSVSVPQRKGDPIDFSQDEHPRASSLGALAKLKPVVRHDGTVTAGNASGLNDGAAAMLVASEDAASRFVLAHVCLAWQQLASRQGSWASVRSRRRAS